MMNFDIKRKINTLRDILVGKVPDPKAQVEQITIALIYKFMDDMDLQGVEFGGARVFFTGEYEKYAFSQIMLAEHSAQDKLNLYAEGMDKMVENPDLPKLFRDILRNTYIPYRDPDTLNRFLKEIAEFSYDNSEDLGNAFEYLLSIMGSQGDAGQFRTPRHIIDMMVEIVAPQKNETILDPACGTAGFLISAYNYIKKSNVDENGNSTLTPDDRNRMTESFEGYDISPDMVRLSRVNMYLHGFTTPHINEYDTLTSLDRWDDSFDVILANPPFMTPKGGINPHNRYRVEAKRAEVLFVDYIMEHLNPTGRAAIIVPEGIVFQSQTAYKNLRKMLADEGYLYGVISLPSGVFNPYSGVKTSILLIDKTLAKAKDSIVFVKLNNDGYDLGAQRREIKGSEIPDVINIFKAYQDGKDVSGLKNAVIASKADIAEHDYILVGDKYKKEDVINSHYPTVKLKDICNIIVGGTPSKEHSEYWENGTIKWISSRYIDDYGNIINSNFITEEAIKKSATKIAPKGSTILVTRVSIGKTAYCEDDYAINQDLTALIPGNKIDSKYLFYITQALKTTICDNALGIGVKGVTQKFVADLEIPLPSIEKQQRIVEEIETYQKIIDGARQVVDNYRPAIKINPEWSMLSLSDFCYFVRGPFGGSLKKEIFVEDGYLVYEQYHAINNDFAFGRYFITEQKFEEMKRFEVLTNDILISCSGTMGKTAIVPENHKRGIINQALLKLTPNNAVLPMFVKLYLESKEIQKKYFTNQSGAAIQNVVSVKELKEIPFPDISIKEQQTIVEEITQEMCMVKQCESLIEIFEKKIQDKLSEVWGE